jgi:hypothetical protein
MAMSLDLTNYHQNILRDLIRKDTYRPRGKVLKKKSDPRRAWPAVRDKEIPC